MSIGVDVLLAERVARLGTPANRVPPLLSGALAPELCSTARRGDGVTKRAVGSAGPAGVAGYDDDGSPSGRERTQCNAETEC